MIFILLFVLTVKTVLAQNLSDFDGVADSLFAMGDNMNNMPDDLSTAYELCRHYYELEPLATYLIPRGHWQWGIRALSNLTANNVCAAYQQNPYQMIALAQEVNDKTLQLSVIRQQFINLLAYLGIGQKGYEMCSNIHQFGCYILSWIQQTLNYLSPSAQITAKPLFQTYISLALAFKPDQHCSWTNVPIALYIPYLCVELNYLTAVRNCRNYMDYH